MSHKATPHGQLNARAPLTSLTRSHAQKGWGGFDRCMVYAMQGLAVCLPSKSAEGRTTAYQIAMASAITERWAREGLKRLEKAGLISWERGGIGKDGLPRPSWIRVNKRAYLAWVKMREWATKKREAVVHRYQAYRKRVKKIDSAPTPPAASPVPAAEPAPAAPVVQPKPAERNWAPECRPSPPPTKPAYLAKMRERYEQSRGAVAPAPTPSGLPIEEVRGAEAAYEMRTVLKQRGYDSLQIDAHMKRPVDGYNGWIIRSKFVKEYGDPMSTTIPIDMARDPEGNMLIKIKE